MQNQRRRRFLEWYAATYKVGAEGRAQFMRDTGTSGEEPITKGRVSQLFDESEPFGELAARNLAVRLGKAENFFEPKGAADKRAAPALDDDAMKFALAYQKLNKQERAAMHLLYTLARAGLQPDKLKSEIIKGDAWAPNDNMIGGNSNFADEEEVPAGKQREQK